MNTIMAILNNLIYLYPWILSWSHTFKKQWAPHCKIIFFITRLRLRYAQNPTKKRAKKQRKSSILHTIRKVKFLSKNSILTQPQHFHEFFIQIFLKIFLVKWKLSIAKKSKTTTFSRVFHPPENGQFSRERKLEFLDKKKISNSGMTLNNANMEKNANVKA